MKNRNTSAPLTSDRSEFIEGLGGSAAERPSVVAMSRACRTYVWVTGAEKPGVPGKVALTRWPTQKIAIAAASTPSARRSRGCAIAAPTRPRAQRITLYSRTTRSSAATAASRTTHSRSGRASSAATSGTNRRSQYRLISRPYSAERSPPHSDQEPAPTRSPQTIGAPGGRRAEPAAGGDEHENERGELDRQHAAPANARRGPGALKRQRRVQKKERDGEADEAEPGMGRLHASIIAYAARAAAYQPEMSNRARAARQPPPRELAGGAIVGAIATISATICTTQMILPRSDGRQRRPHPRPQPARPPRRRTAAVPTEGPTVPPCPYCQTRIGQHENQRGICFHVEPHPECADRPGAARHPPVDAVQQQRDDSDEHHAPGNNGRHRPGGKSCEQRDEHGAHGGDLIGGTEVHGTEAEPALRATRVRGLRPGEASIVSCGAKAQNWRMAADAAAGVLDRGSGRGRNPDRAARHPIA